MFMVGITQRTVCAENYHELRDALSHDWQKYLYSLFPEGILVSIPNTLPDPENWVESLSINALVFSNGENWGENSLRDMVETRLLAWAIQNQVPVLGVCRGLQIINRLYGGSISSDIADACKIPHVGRHSLKITVEPFRTKIGETIHSVNSYHNQGVLNSDLAENLDAFALCGECVEGLFDIENAVMAIQWHPERDGGGGEKVDNLIKDFLTGKYRWSGIDKSPQSCVEGE